MSDNYSSGVSTLILANGNGFSANDYVLLGEFGHEQSEIVQANSVSSNTLTLSAATNFAHSQDTKVTIIKYNQVRFYRTTTATFSSNSANALTGYIDIQADSKFTITYDTTNTTGYGWFIFYNETTTKATQSSNAIPYGGFEENSVRNVIDGFYSLLNNKETKLISSRDAYQWMNEAYSTVNSELNIVNESFNLPSLYPITVSSGTAEYALPNNFSRIVSVWSEGDDLYLSKIDANKLDLNDELASNTTGYYIRQESGTYYLGLSPSPTGSDTLGIRYKKKSEVLDSPYDNVYLPDDNFYILIDFMLYKASKKLGKVDAESNYKMFRDGLNRLKIIGHKQDEHHDQFEIAPESNV